MKRRYEVIATVGKWTHQDTKKPVKRSVAVGAIYESTGGKLVLRIDAIPVAPDWSGWMQLRPCSPEMPPGRRLPPGMPAAPPPVPDESDEPEDDVPF